MRNISLQIGTDWKRKLQRGPLFLFSLVISKLVKAWIFANTTKSSSVCDSSRQLFTLTSTASSENCCEHWPPLKLREHPQPLLKKFFTLATISSFSALGSSFSKFTSLDSAMFRLKCDIDINVIALSETKRSPRQRVSG